MQRTINTKFFTFSQNNSGGYFVDDYSKGIAHYVIVEAIDEDDAISRAENIGLYFDGWGDCPCCGNRWSSYVEGEEFPEIYGTRQIPCEDVTKSFIHYIDGTFVNCKADDYIEEE